MRTPNRRPQKLSPRARRALSPRARRALRFPAEASPPPGSRSRARLPSSPERAIFLPRPLRIAALVRRRRSRKDNKVNCGFLNILCYDFSFSLCLVLFCESWFLIQGIARRCLLPPRCSKIVRALNLRTIVPKILGRSGPDERRNRYDIFCWYVTV